MLSLKQQKRYQIYTVYFLPLVIQIEMSISF